MTAERWEKLKPLFQGALDLPRERRGEWLREAAGGDQVLLADAQALLDAHETAGGFLETPPSVDLDDALDEGRRLGPYVIRGELGRGGMGIVYLAEDLRLGRSVALKALPAILAGDVQRRERLRREARAAAALMHPGIAVVYALEEFDGELFIASEHVKGRSLRAELAEGPAGVERALDTAIQLARALCAAHDAGIVHRDLKPENVLRTEAGDVKILDFGIAQFTDRTLTQLTMTGAALGTPAYMAPEQLAGGDVDFRADIYAVGVILAELAAGVHPMGTGLSAPLPDPVRSVADRCMARDPRSRYETTRELLSALERARRALARGSAEPARRFTPRWWWEFHQATAALVYGMMAMPLWSARGLIGGVAGRTIFVVGLAAIIVSATVRLHFWFTSRFYPGEIGWVRARAGAWVTSADAVFALTLAAAGLIVGDDHAPLATLLLAVGIGSAVAFLVIERVTERAAFESRPSPGG